MKNRKKGIMMKNELFILAICYEKYEKKKNCIF